MTVVSKEKQASTFHNKKQIDILIKLITHDGKPV